jgi:hypothetical protein
VADVVLSTVDLDVFGGPTSIDVSVDFGQTGTRGSRIWAGSGDPEVYLAAQDIKLFDLYINTNTEDNFYSWLYQYIIEVGNPAWVPILKLDPSQYSTIASTTFTAGSTTINIPISSITEDSGTVVADFIIRYNIANANPVATAFTSSIVGTDLRIVIKAAEFASTTWSDLAGSKDVHLFISYVA